MRSPYERQAQKELEAAGYLVDYKARPFRVPRGYQVDYFGAFDLVAQRNYWHLEREGVFATAPQIPELRFIAIKGHQGVPGELRRKIEGFRFPEGVTKEIWTYRADHTVRKEVIE